MDPSLLIEIEAEARARLTRQPLRRDRRSPRGPRDRDDRDRRDEPEQQVAPPGRDRDAHQDRDPLDADVERGARVVRP